MTATQYPHILGSAWGCPLDMEGVQHHWGRTLRATWRSDCAETVTKGTYHFHGVDYVTLSFDPEGEFCEKCLEIFLETDYGKEFGVHPPHRPDLEINREDS